MFHSFRDDDEVDEIILLCLQERKRERAVYKLLLLLLRTFSVATNIAQYIYIIWYMATVSKILLFTFSFRGLFFWFLLINGQWLVWRVAAFRLFDSISTSPPLHIC